MYLIVPQEGRRSLSVMAMCFSMFLSLSAFPVAPRLSWQWAVGCPSMPTAASQLRQSQSHSQGEHRATRDGTSPSQLCPAQAQRAPGALLPRTGQTCVLLLAVAEVIWTGPLQLCLCWLWESYWHQQGHIENETNCPVWQPQCENLGASFSHSYLWSSIKELNVLCLIVLL